MKVDIVKAKSGHMVYPRDGAPKGWDDKYESAPLYGPADDGDCMDWCEQNNHQFRHRQQAALVPPHFFNDLEKQCDIWLAELNRFAEMCGRKLETDVTYRASAAWKENPTHYCYSGDMGGTAQLQRVDESKANADALMEATTLLHVLFGASRAVWEMGFTLTFDKDGKHTIFNKREQWVTLDEEEY